MAKNQSIGLDPHQKALVGLIDDNARRYRRHEVFSDFCEMAALAYSNRADRAQFEEREARYMAIVGKYERVEVERFPRMLVRLAESLQLGFHDSLGEIFMALELADHWKGQFFTPYPVSYLMAQLAGVADVATIQREGFVMINEPACGAGGMLIAAANAMHDAGINYQQHMHATAIDIDLTAVHMTYVQLTLLHVPAIVVHGNGLSTKRWSHWITFAHTYGMWDFKLARAQRRQPVPPDAESQPHMICGMPDSAPAGADQAANVDVGEIRGAVVAARLEQLSLFG